MNKREKSPDKYERSRDKKTQSKMDKGYDSKMSPGKDRDKEQRGKIVDPRRNKVNAPVVKQHIREFTSAFCKRF